MASSRVVSVLEDVRIPRKIPHRMAGSMKTDISLSKCSGRVSVEFTYAPSALNIFVDFSVNLLTHIHALILDLHHYEQATSATRYLPLVTNLCLVLRVTVAC